MPKTEADGFRRMCDERKYAHIGTNMFTNLESSSLSCRIVSLPGTSYPEILSYIISNTSHYKGLINWRWVPYTMIWTISVFALLSNRKINLHVKHIGHLDLQPEYWNTDIHQCWYVRSAVGPKHKLVINIILILIAERGRCELEGHNIRYRNTTNSISRLDNEQNVYIINFVIGVL